MASFDVTTRNNSTITVPDFAKLNIDGLQIIGDQTEDWNEPYNKNFLVLDKKIMTNENSIVELNTTIESINHAKQDTLVFTDFVTEFDLAK